MTVAEASPGGRRFLDRSLVDVTRAPPGPLCWLAAMTKFELSYAYPFMSLAFVLVLVLSALLFHEALTTAKILGVLLIIAGIIVGSRG